MDRSKVAMTTKKKEAAASAKCHELPRGQHDRRGSWTSDIGNERGRPAAPGKGLSAGLIAVIEPFRLPDTLLDATSFARPFHEARQSRKPS